MGKHGNKYQVNLHSQKIAKNLSQDLYAFSVNRRVLLLRSEKKDSLTVSMEIHKGAIFDRLKIILVYYAMRSKNEVFCAAAGRLAAERSEADKPTKAHKTIFTTHNIFYSFFKPS
jgi:hypothetical protein